MPMQLQVPGSSGLGWGSAGRHKAMKFAYGVQSQEITAIWSHCHRRRHRTPVRTPLGLSTVSMDCGSK
jgi:hypothetical protein